MIQDTAASPAASATATPAGGWTGTRSTSASPNRVSHRSRRTRAARSPPRPAHLRHPCRHAGDHPCRRPPIGKLEEGAVSFGGIAAGPADLARLIVAEFALVDSDDYFLFPCGYAPAVSRGSPNSPAGTRLANVSTSAQPPKWDEEAPGVGRPWAFFELSGDLSAGEGRAPWLLLPAALPVSQLRPPLELVGFVRDEQANLTWTIEERVETATGGSVRRRLLPEPASVPAPPEPGGPGRYRLQTPVPPYWIPFVPEPFGPEGGAQIRRRQFARGADGHPHLWMARRKRPGRGERGSGWGFDLIDRG